MDAMNEREMTAPHSIAQWFPFCTLQWVAHDKPPWLSRGQHSAFDPLCAVNYLEEALRGLGSTNISATAATAEPRAFNARNDSLAAAVRAQSSMLNLLIYCTIAKGAVEYKRSDACVSEGLTIGLRLQCLDALEHLVPPSGPALLGTELTLADLYLAPMMQYFVMAREGADLLRARPRLTNWSTGGDKSQSTQRSSISTWISKSGRVRPSMSI